MRYTGILYKHIYIHIYIYIYRVYIYIYIYIYIYKCINELLSNVSMRMPLHIHSMCMSASLYIYIYIYIHTHTHAYIHIHTRVRTQQIHLYAHTNTHAYTIQQIALRYWHFEARRRALVLNKVEQLQDVRGMSKMMHVLKAWRTDALAARVARSTCMENAWEGESMPHGRM
jgi:hypothetical protein